jgi:hypothetical protein
MPAAAAKPAIGTNIFLSTCINVVSCRFLFPYFFVFLFSLFSGVLSGAFGAPHFFILNGYYAGCGFARLNESSHRIAGQNSRTKPSVMIVPTSQFEKNTLKSPWLISID